MLVQLTFYNKYLIVCYFKYKNTNHILCYYHLFQTSCLKIQMKQPNFMLHSVLWNTNFKILLQIQGYKSDFVLFSFLSYLLSQYISGEAKLYLAQYNNQIEEAKKLLDEAKDLNIVFLKSCVYSSPTSYYKIPTFEF